MALLGKDAIDFAAKRSARLAANAKGNWRKVAAFGAAAAVVFVVAAVGYAGLGKLRRRDEQPPEGDDQPDPEPDEPDQSA